MPAARYPSDRFDGTGGAAENEAIARIRGTGAGLIDQVISASCKPPRIWVLQKVLCSKNWSAQRMGSHSHGC